MMFRLRISLLALTMALCCVFGCTPSKQPATTDEMVQQAVQEGTHRTWYSSEKSDYVVPETAHHEQLANRLDRTRVDTPAAPTRTPGTFPRSLASILKFVGILTLAILLGLLIYFLFSISNLNLIHRKRSRANEILLSKVTDLPIPLETPLEGLLAEADRLRKLGQYSQAMIYLYGHILLELDQAHCIRIQRGKTNGMYLRELRSHPQLASFSKRVFLAFEWVFFGKHTLREEYFQSIWNQLDGFHSVLTGKANEESSQGLVTGQGGSA